MRCILCLDENVDLYIIIERKIYWKCNNCFAIFLDKKFYLDKESEKQHYLKHQNYIEDNNYQRFLSKLYTPLKYKLRKNDKGLDYGCGHGPALAYMLKTDGFEVDLYDPFFYPNKKIFKKKYDFITCTEVVEHFFNPYQEFKRLDDLLKINSWLGIMTSFYDKSIHFEDWYYRRDPSHVIFYTINTFHFLAESKGWNCEIASKNVVLLNKL